MGGEWLRLSVSLTSTFLGGKLVEPAPEFTGGIQGLDEVSAGYTLTSWLSGVTSGAFFAFRHLKAELRRLTLHALEGSLRAASMPALAIAAARAVAELLGRPITLDLDGWREASPGATPHGA